MTASDSGIRGEGRERLIRVAAECYAKSRAMKISEVSQHAGASIGTIYHHFPAGARDLEAALFLDTLTTYQEGLLGALERNPSAAAGIKQVVTFHLEWMAENPALAHFLLFYSPTWLSPGHKEVLREMNANFARAAADWRHPHIQAGRIKRLPPEDYGPLILAAAQQHGIWVITESKLEDIPAALKDAAPRYANAAWEAVKGP